MEGCPSWVRGGFCSTVCNRKHKAEAGEERENKTGSLVSERPALIVMDALEGGALARLGSEKGGRNQRMFWYWRCDAPLVGQKRVVTGVTGVTVTPNCRVCFPVLAPICEWLVCCCQACSKSPVPALPDAATSVH